MIGTLLIGATIAVGFALRPVPTHELRFRWRYQRRRVFVICLLAFLVSAACVLGVGYLEAHLLAHPPSGWLWKGLVSGFLVAGILRVDVGSVILTPAIDAPGAGEGFSIAREITRRMYETVADATGEDVAAWVQAQTPTFRSAGQLAVAINLRAPPNTGVAQDNLVQAQEDLTETNPPDLREDARHRIRAWACGKISENTLLLHRNWRD